MQEMSVIEKIQLFEQKKVRTAWDEDKQEWFFSIVDVCGVLTEQPDYDHAKNYWKVLKFRLIKEGNELVTNCNQLKMVSPKDGKRYSTDVADMALMFRIIESIPSKKAEPFKIWMAQVAAERFGFGKYSCISQSRSISSIKRFENCPARGTGKRLAKMPAVFVPEAVPLLLTSLTPPRKWRSRRVFRLFLSYSAIALAE